MILSFVFYNFCHVLFIWIFITFFCLYRRHLFIFHLLFAEIELNLVQVEIDEFNLLNEAMHKTATFLSNVLPKFDHFPETLT